MKCYLINFVLGFFCFQQSFAHDPSIYIGSRESDPASLVENVSTIYGDYTEIEVDLTVSAPDSLILSRFYSSRDTLQTANFGGWRFNPHCFLRVQKDPKGKAYTTSEGKFERTSVQIGNPDGSILTYVGWYNSSDLSKPALFKIDPEEEALGLANTAKGMISCWTNLKNNALYFNAQTDCFELLLGSEGKRFYAKHPSLDVYLITYEILPSGNKIFYEFDEKAQLVFIKETNASVKKVLAWIKIEYGKEIFIEASDGKTVQYHFQEDSSGANLLTEVLRSDKPTVQYQYQVMDDRALLLKKSLPEGRYVQVGYYTDRVHQHKVKSITTPTDLNIQFSYEDNCTAVNGPGSHRALYKFDDDFQLIAVEHYLDGSPYRIHKKSWGTKRDAGNLISTSVEDGNGHIFYHKQYTYDSRDNGNIVEERECGDLAGENATFLSLDNAGAVINQSGHTKNYAYFSGKTTHGFFQKDAQGAGIKHWYKKGTNLLLKKYILTRGSDKEEDDDNAYIIKRHFYTYNEDAVLVRVVVDDGRKGELDGFEDFYSVTERLITSISPKQELPNVGAPEIIEQKYRSSDKRSELLLKKTINQFDGRGTIVSQAIYDADDKYCYTLAKEYTNGLLAFETDPLGNETRYSYDANQNLIAEYRSDSGISIEYGYDLNNRLIDTSQKDRFGKQFETHVSYDQAGCKVAEVDRFGNRTFYTHDGLGRSTTVTHPGGKCYAYAYDLFDNLIAVTDPKGRTLKKSYNIHGEPTEIQHFDGTKELFRYESGGNLRQYYGKDGLLQIYSYDSMGRLTKLEYFNRQKNNAERVFKKKTYKYNTFHKLQEADEKDNVTHYTYDKAGRLATLEKDKKKVEFLYDSLGRQYGVKKWKSADTFTLELKEYDFLDRVIEERIEETQGRVLVKKRYIYNEAGQLAQVISYPQNIESILMQYEYDGFGRLCKIITATGHATAITYDDTYVNEWGQKTLKRMVIDPLGNGTEEIFDIDEKLIKVTTRDKSGQLLTESESSYDSSDNKVLERSALLSDGVLSGMYETTRSFNGGDQLESIIFGKATPQEHRFRFEYNAYGDLSATHLPGFKEPVIYQYNNEGNLETVSYKEDKKEVIYKLSHDLHHNLIRLKSDSNFATNYFFDASDLLLTEKIEDDFGSYRVSRTYDGEKKIDTLQLPDGSSVKYVYEGPFVKTVKRFSRDGKELYNYHIASRDQMGNTLEEILPGNLGERKQFWDAAGRRIGITTDFFQDKVLEDGYDALGNLRKREVTLEETTYAAEYDYDALSRLIAERGKIEHVYAYDSLDNRLEKDTSVYKVDEANQLIEADGIIYTFDQQGNLATKTIGDQTWAYQSNPLNQIISITDPEQNRVKFTYDLSGKRFTKRSETKNKKSKVQRFFYLGETEIGSLDEKGNIVELKIPSDPNNPEAPCIAIEIKQEVYVPLYDLQGSIVCLLDPQRRKLVESYRYSVYGEEEITNAKGRAVADSSIGNPWRYRGKRVDKEIGLIYFGYRYYSPETGRWITPDPLGSIDGPNLYAYALNNPMSYVDYFGLASDSNENQSCVCGHCERAEFCHCLLGIDYPECVCKGIFCDHKRARSIVSVGSKITSALGGVGHGVVDFMVGSLQDLQTTALHVGAGELELTLQERVQIIKAVEQSQATQMSMVDSWIMDTLSFNQSDTVYQSFRSTTTIGLEVGSLIAGGYGAVKGIINFARLAKMPTQVSRLAKIIGKAESYVNRGASFAGSKRAPLNYAPYQTIRNKRATINGREYTGHSLDRMQDRGFMPANIENVLQTGTTSPANFSGGLEYYDSVNKIKVIVGETGQIITIIPGKR